MDIFSSPTREDGFDTSPAAQLTPQSKIKALMARLDADSDSDDAQMSPIARRPPLAEVDGNHARLLHDAGKEEREVTEPEDIDLVGIYSTIATVKDDEGELTDCDGNDDPSSAYARIKAQMLRGELDAVAGKEDRTGRDKRLAESEDESQSDDDLDDIVPKGRLAGRLRSKVSPEKMDDQADEHIDDTQPRLTHNLDTMSDEEGRGLSAAALGSSPPASLTTPLKRGRFFMRKKAKQIDSGSDIESPSISDEEASSPTLDGKDESSQVPNSRFLELVARKREERLAREAKEEEQHRQRMERLAEELNANNEARMSSKQKGKQPVRRPTTRPDNHSDEDDDPLSSQKLEENSRPPRKASKKALEEMSKETQRISRNMQLAHDARTKKKITKASLFQRFNFRGPVAEAPAPVDTTATSSSAPHSDNEDSRDHQTPPTSPVSSHQGDRKQGSMQVEGAQASMNKVVVADDLAKNLADLEGAGESEEITPEATAKAVAANAPFASVPTYHASTEQATGTLLPKGVALKDFVRSRRVDVDSDSDLEVIPAKQSALLATFERVQPLAAKGNERKAMKTLRALAHLASPKSKTTQTSMTPATLQVMLRKRARQQAALERAEKIQDLRDRGIIVRTEEERERDQEQIEDMLEKARQENENLARMEKNAAKKEAIANGEELPSSDEDEDYEEGADEDQLELELSGSEDEDEASADEAEDLEGEDAGLVDDEAEDENEEGDNEDPGPENVEESEVEDVVVPLRHQRRGKARLVVEDDDEDLPQTLDNKAQEKTIQNPFFDTAAALQGPSLPVEASDAKNPFNIAGDDNAPMGLTQAFAATMADSQDQGQPIEDEDSLGRLEVLPPPDFLGVGEESLLTLTQSNVDSGLQLDLHLSQSQVQYDTMALNVDATQSEMPDPTQDAGFGMSSPVKDRFAQAPPSTVDTLLIAEKINESPVAPRKGRLRRGVKPVADFSDEELSNDEREDSVFSEGEDDKFTVNADAFNIMKRAAKKARQPEDIFDKKTSNAKDMVDEQAQESEDEYAGLGGASDDESDGEMDEEVRRMIDEGAVDVNERQLAAFHANKERVDDEKAVEKLFKDINNGGLRRKRNAEFDLSDSDDDVEDRRRRKRAEFARMRKALLADEKVGKIAEDPKKVAFLRAIEDREDGEYYDVLDDVEESQSANLQEVPDSQPEAILRNDTNMGNKRKRSAGDETPGEPAPKRAPAAARRTRESLARKPLTLAEIRASVSFLTEDPSGMSAEPEHLLDASEGEEELSRASADAPRRGEAVVDRLVIKRAESLNIVQPADGERLAFQHPEFAAAPGFRVPSLLRRATTQLTAFAAVDANGVSHGGSVSTSSNSSVVSMERVAGGDRSSDVVKKSMGGKRSSVNFVAREAARRGQVEGTEKRRREGMLNAARKARGETGLVGMLKQAAWE